MALVSTQHCSRGCKKRWWPTTFTLCVFCSDQLVMQNCQSCRQHALQLCADACVSLLQAQVEAHACLHPGVVTIPSFRTASFQPCSFPSFCTWHPTRTGTLCPWSMAFSRSLLARL